MPLHQNSISTALTIAGSDPGCNAGIQADIKAIAACGTHPLAIITCLTAQNPKIVSHILPIAPDFILAQLQTTFDYFHPLAMKTGMLYSAEIIEVISYFLKGLKFRPQLVIDPVMIASSGAKLLSDNAIDTLIHHFIPLAELITPNLDEAAILLNSSVAHTFDSLKSTAEALVKKYKVNVLLKGGHIDSDQIYDVLALKNQEMIFFSEKRITNLNSHGSGCTLSAAIAAFLAQNISLPQAVQKARDYLLYSMKNPISICGENFINHVHIPT